MKSKDLISVIIPAYNAEKYIVNCVESVAAQTYQHLEIIVVNDGSTDLTGQLLDEIAKKDTRIKVIHQKNQGVSAARNTGLSQAKGDCIGFVDADDEVAQDMYEFLYDNLVTYHADISHCGFELVKSNEIVKFHGTGVLMEHNTIEGLKELLSGKQIEPSACTKLYRKSTIEQVLFPTDIKINEDLLFNIEAFKNAKTMVFEDQIKYRYLYNPSSASRTSFDIEKATDIHNVATRIKNLLPEKELADEVNQFYVGKLLNNLKALKSGNLFSSDLAELHLKELRKIDSRNMGLRIRTLKSLLLDFPFLYDGFIYCYNLLFAKNQKWK